MSLSWSLTNLEAGVWTPEWSTDINPKKPDLFQIQQFAGGLQIFCAGTEYAGALAKNVSPLIAQLPKLTFNYVVTIGPSIDWGQIIETDPLVTDAAGWTSDNAATQFLIEKGWLVQIGDGWPTNTVAVPLVQGPNHVSIDFLYDYVNHTSQHLSINGIPLNVPPMPAKQMGWTPSEIVTQLQLCTGAKGGCYDLQFSNISYSGTN